MIIPRHYEDLSILHENTLPNRCYYIPASKRLRGSVEDRLDSDRLQLLSGLWRFRYHSSIYDAQEPFYELGYDHSGFDTVQVPGLWQNYGYDHHQYTNIRYPFPVDPPYVPQEDPCGEYILEFDYSTDPDAPCAYLDFEGVDSCFYVWLNGSYVGYSQVSHASAEFDVTQLLKDGRNKLAVLVLKWCDGSYLEDQDKFRMSGIFRDVFLLKRPKAHIRDFTVTTSLTAAIVRLDSGAIVRASLYDGDELVASGSGKDSITLVPENVIPWNAEAPKLYDLFLETENEVISEKVGFRQIAVKNKVVCLNDVPVHFRGVNRHDSDPVTGFAISVEQATKDLLLMKQHNVNAIRTSHYPNSPWFYQLCDRYGFYVIDEADNESHGMNCQIMKATGWDAGMILWSAKIANDPSWNGAIVDRAKLLVSRDKNRPSVVIWSMGNEGGFGCGFEEALKWTKNADPTRLTHYEGARYVPHDHDFDFSDLDLHSRMYPNLSEIEEYLSSDPDKPYILCEYSHAMGNGPGDLEAYYRMFHDHDLMCGGFVWEWCDHAIFKGVAADGRNIYYYGGDHQEYPHDGNFCVDGLVFPDRRPHTGLKELKNVQRPARVTAFDQENGLITLENQLDHLDLKDYIDITWELTCDGETVASGDVQTPSVLPHGTAQLELAFPAPEKGRTYLKLSYFRKYASELLPKGYPLGFDEMCVEVLDSRNQRALSFVSSREGELSVKENDRYITVFGEGIEYTFNKLTGLWNGLTVDGMPRLGRPMELNIWRAPTDNDRNEKNAWMDRCYHMAYTRSYKTQWHIENGSVLIRSTLAVVADTIQPIISGEILWTVRPNGEIGMDIAMRKDPDFAMLPRFGFRMFLPKEYDSAEYYGMGPNESYRDLNKSSWHGKFVSSVQELHVDYIRPQENGSHFDCDYVCLSGEGRAVAVVGDRTFSFNASHYTQEELTEKAHNYELEESGFTVLCVDVAQTGIGSNSCGPSLAAEHRFDPDMIEAGFRIVL